MGTNLSELIVNTYLSGSKILICGNGGLAAESEHFAAEMMGRFGKDISVPCIALTANSSLITALSNDRGYETVFSHQVVGLGKPGDLLIGMTTSASPNIRKALLAGREKYLRTVCLCGKNSPEMSADYTIIVEGQDTASIQEGILAELHKAAWSAKVGIE